jgi:hypothetical protein
LEKEKKAKLEAMEENYALKQRLAFEGIDNSFSGHELELDASVIPRVNDTNLNVSLGDDHELNSSRVSLSRRENSLNATMNSSSILSNALRNDESNASRSSNINDNASRSNINDNASRSNINDESLKNLPQGSPVARDRTLNSSELNLDRTKAYVIDESVNTTTPHVKNAFFHLSESELNLDSKNLPEQLESSLLNLSGEDRPLFESNSELTPRDHSRTGVIQGYNLSSSPMSQLSAGNSIDLSQEGSQRTHRQLLDVVKAFRSGMLPDDIKLPSPKRTTVASTLQTTNSSNGGSSTPTPTPSNESKSRRNSTALDPTQDQQHGVNVKLPNIVSMSQDEYQTLRDNDEKLKRLQSLLTGDLLESLRSLVGSTSKVCKVNFILIFIFMYLFIYFHHVFIHDSTL